MSFSGTARSIFRKGWLVALAVTAPLASFAQTYTPTPITTSVFTAPYRYTGLLLARTAANNSSGFTGSGAVVGHPRVVYSCAHLVYDDETGGWLPDVRWFPMWNSGRTPSLSSGRVLRGYRFFQGYASAARSDSNSSATYSLDFVVHYSYENTSDGTFAMSAGEAAPEYLKSSRQKLITGYPSGLYAADAANRYLMHETGPFARSFSTITSSFFGVEEVSAAPGNSGGPVWVKEGENYYYAGTVLAGAARSLGDPTDVLGAYVLNSASEALVGEALVLTVSGPPQFTSQPASRRVSAGGQASFTASASGIGVKYQWYFNDQPISGATGISTTVTASATTAGSYYVVASNEAGQVNSERATLVVEPRPTITRQPVAMAAGPGTTVVFSVEAMGIDLTYQWYKNNSLIFGATGSTFVLGVTSAAGQGGQYHVVATDAYGVTVTSVQTTLSVFTAVANMQLQPVSQRKKAGESVTFAAKTGAANAAYTWFFNGAVIPGANGPTYTVAHVRPVNAGAYRVLVFDGTLNGWSDVATLAVDASRLVNISTRAYVPPGGLLTPGFVIRGASNTKTVLARAAGPALRDYQVSAPLQNPSLSLVSQDLKAEVAENKNWNDSPFMRNTVNGVGAFPFNSGSRDAAATQMLVLNNYGYTVKVADEGSTGGIALAEVYDPEPAGASQIINVSTLGFAGTGERVLIAGFVVQGNIPKPLLIRGVGPGLEPYGVGERLADPQIQLVRQSDGSTLAINDNWGGTAELKAAFAKAGAFELTNNNSRDAALITTLAPGVYTVVISGVSGATGNVLVEIYDLEF